MPVVTAAEAAQEVQQWAQKMNGSRSLPPTLARIRKLQTEEVFSICNIGPWPHRLERGCLIVDVPAYDPALDHDTLGYAASIPMPDVRREAKIINEDEFGYFEDDGRMVARDMIGIGHSLPISQSLVQYGVFVPEGKHPSKEEIHAAHKQLNGTIDRLISEARQAYDKGPVEREKVINERHLWAARKRGINEAWVHHQHTQESIACEMCGQFNPAAVAKCKCGNIINFELYKRIVAKQQEQMAELELETATKPAKK